MGALMCYKQLLDTIDVTDLLRISFMVPTV